MNNTLFEMIRLYKEIEKSACIDFEDLRKKNLDEKFFEDYNNIRIVNSFLFNFSKLQDKIGSKLFKKFLYELQEIDSFEVSMIEILNILEKLNILQIDEWQRLREIRNILAHEYTYDLNERIENIQIAMEGFTFLQKILNRIEKKANETLKR
ncbi:hypothetical protein [Nitratiruptor sp. SB155-2]|uniref:hypothetical protein n=1 Tax=Nitratiruptor sp. (strain SB155-2) TaxID=387092 RepID=UPI000305667B|nr:hypothetical protein [Nitratiruptor sp. SB155-2]